MYNQVSCTEIDESLAHVLGAEQMVQLIRQQFFAVFLNNEASVCLNNLESFVELFLAVLLPHVVRELFEVARSNVDHLLLSHFGCVRQVHFLFLLLDFLRLVVLPVFLFSRARGCEAGGS